MQHALEAWLKVHPLARGIGLLDEQPCSSASAATDTVSVSVSGGPGSCRGNRRTFLAW